MGDKAWIPRNSVVDLPEVPSTYGQGLDVRVFSYLAWADDPEEFPWAHEKGTPQVLDLDNLR